MWIFIVLVISGVSARDIDLPVIRSTTPMYQDTTAREQEEVHCPSNMLFDSTENECECVEKTVYYSPKDSCFNPFEQGPCKPGHYLAIPRDADVAECVVNICGNNGTLPYNNSCYFLETMGPCKSGDVLRINLDTFQIECTDYYYASREMQMIRAPINNVTVCEPGKKSTATGQCKKKLEEA